MGPEYDRIELFVPEGDRRSKTTPVDLHDRWVIRLLRLCTDLFGGATSYGRGVGAWKSGSALHWDRVTVIEVWVDYASEGVGANLLTLQEALRRMGQALRQEAVACIIKGSLCIVDCEVRP